MTALFGRSWFLSVGSLDIGDLDLSFKIEKSTLREPNTAEIVVYNLSAASRSLIEAGGIVQLRAGYGSDCPILFRGDSRDVWTVPDAVDSATTITARDGGRAYSEARVSQPYGPGTACTQPLRDAIRVMEIGEGNLSDFTAAFALRNGADTFADGYVAHGPAHRVVNDIVRGAGLRWSVQNGSLQILQQGRALQSRSVVLSSDSGMVESPAWDDRGHRTRGRAGTVTAKALIQPGLEPGRQVRIESRNITGDFEIRKVTYQGDTRADDWYATIEGRPCR
jgi:hypothetical protein